jgi:Tripartite tricarboxylate transporter family receptor
VAAALAGGHRHETSPPEFSAPRRGRGRFARCAALGARRHLSVAPGAHSLRPAGSAGPEKFAGEATSFEGIAAPKNTPVEIVDKLNKAINAGFTDPRFKARLADLGGEGMVGTPADFSKVIADETEKWGNVVKFAGLKAE